MTSLVDRLAATLLYEGYLLYPYRASALKNRQRFTFGVLFPESLRDAQAGLEPSALQTECLVEGADPLVRVRVKFLQLLHRQFAELADEPAAAPREVEALVVDGRRYQTWQEALEREVCAPDVRLLEAITQPVVDAFAFGPDETIEELRDAQGRPVGRLVQTQQRICGEVVLRVVALAPDLHRLQVVVRNTTPLTRTDLRRDDALPLALASAHVLLEADRGEFVSLLEPPPHHEAAARGCVQAGCWPVLVGPPGERRTMLASPIILYDYPEIAAESPGDFFDGTEIDEMLMLRVQTLTPAEQHEMRSIDERSRRLLERTESLPEDDLRKLHGTMRGSG